MPITIITESLRLFPFITCFDFKTYLYFFFNSALIDLLKKEFCTSTICDNLRNVEDGITDGNCLMNFSRNFPSFVFVLKFLEVLLSWSRDSNKYVIIVSKRAWSSSTLRFSLKIIT